MNKCGSSGEEEKGLGVSKVESVAFVERVNVEYEKMMVIKGKS